MIHAICHRLGEKPRFDGCLVSFSFSFFMFLDPWWFELFLLAIAETDLGAIDKSINKPKSNAKKILLLTSYVRHDEK